MERRYEAVDDPAEVRRDETGVWHIRRGSRVKVRVTVATSSRRYHAALTDPLPAGLEPYQPGNSDRGERAGQSGCATQSMVVVATPLVRAPKP